MIGSWDSSEPGWLSLARYSRSESLFVFVLFIYLQLPWAHSLNSWARAMLNQCHGPDEN